MTLDEAFTLWYSKQDHSGLPWQTAREELFNVFYAGWHAHIEAVKQADMFPGHLSEDLCKDKVVVATVTPEDIYAAYPRKIGKQAAIKAINKVPSKWRDGGFAMRSYLLERTQAYAAATAKWPSEDKQYIPHPATWFNRGSYDDDPKEWQRGADAAPSQFSKKYV